MNRCENIMYKFKGDKIAIDETLRLLCESIDKVINQSVEKADNQTADLMNQAG